MRYPAADDPRRNARSRPALLTITIAKRLED
jgi:hypothetical protein